MSAPASEDLRELERLLLVAAETGDAREFAGLQEELALGHDDLQKALDTLREHGKAQEIAPGQWSGPDVDTPMQPKGPLVVSVPSPEDVMDEFDDHGAVPGDERRTMLLEAGATVRLTPGVAAALDAPALGAIVQAGIAEASEAGIPFVLVVG